MNMHLPSRPQVDVPKILLALSVLLAVLACVPETGAYYFDSRQGTITTTTVGLGLALTNPTAADTTTLDFNFSGLKPGDSLTKTFTVKNTGSIPGVLSLYSDGLKAPGLTQNDLAGFGYRIDSYGSLNPVSGAWLAIGTLQGGESRTYTLVNSLDSSVGGEWQNKTITSSLRMVLEQPH